MISSLTYPLLEPSGPNLDPTVGMPAAAAAGGATAVVVYIVLSIWGLRSSRLIFDAVYRLVPSVLAGMSLMAVLLPLINVISQLHIVVASFPAELSSGAVTLRLVSLLLGAKILWLTLHVVTVEERAPPFIVSPPTARKGLLLAVRRALHFRTLKFPEVRHLTLRLTCSDIDLLIMARGGFFLFTLLSLWTFDAVGYSSALTLSINLSLFFFVDDWNIIGDYVRAFRGRILPAHRWRMRIANIVIAPALVIALFQGLPVPLATVSAALVAMLLLWQGVISIVHVGNVADT